MEMLGASLINDRRRAGVERCNNDVENIPLILPSTWEGQSDNRAGPNRECESIVQKPGVMQIARALQHRAKRNDFYISWPNCIRYREEIRWEGFDPRAADTNSNCGSCFAVLILNFVRSC